MWNDLTYRLRALVRRKAVESEMDDELAISLRAAGREVRGRGDDAGGGGAPGTDRVWGNRERQRGVQGSTGRIADGNDGAGCLLRGADAAEDPGSA